jgi:signal transduction histidine kinase
MERVSVKSLLSDIVTLSQSKFVSKGIDFLHPESFEDIRLNCNAVEVSQILLNFLNNAMDAVSELKEKWVRLDFKIEKSSVKVLVIDSGVGIPEDQQEKIFEAFYTTKAIGKGTGLGLSLCRSFAENNKAKVYIDSKSPNTCFVLELPKESNE